MDNIEIRLFKPSDLESFNTTLNFICVKRRHLASIDGFTLEKSQQFIQNSASTEMIQQVAAIGTAHAYNTALEKIELHVFSDNASPLYRQYPIAVMLPAPATSRYRKA